MLGSTHGTGRTVSFSAEEGPSDNVVRTSRRASFHPDTTQGSTLGTPHYGGGTQGDVQKPTEGTRRGVSFSPERSLGTIRGVTGGVGFSPEGELRSAGRIPRRASFASDGTQEEEYSNPHTVTHSEGGVRGNDNATQRGVGFPADRSLERGHSAARGVGFFPELEPSIRSVDPTSRGARFPPDVTTEEYGYHITSLPEGEMRGNNEATQGGVNFSPEEAPGTEYKTLGNPHVEARSVHFPPERPSTTRTTSWSWCCCPWWSEDDDDVYSHQKSQDRKLTEALRMYQELDVEKFGGLLEKAASLTASPIEDVESLLETMNGNYGEFETEIEQLLREHEAIKSVVSSIEGEQEFKITQILQKHAAAGRKVRDEVDQILRLVKHTNAGKKEIREILEGLGMKDSDLRKATNKVLECTKQIRSAQEKNSGEILNDIGSLSDIAVENVRVEDDGKLVVLEKRFHINVKSGRARKPVVKGFSVSCKPDAVHGRRLPNGVIHVSLEVGNCSPHAPVVIEINRAACVIRKIEGNNLAVTPRRVEIGSDPKEFELAFDDFGTRYQVDAPPYVSSGVKSKGRERGLTVVFSLKRTMSWYERTYDKTSSKLGNLFKAKKTHYKVIGKTGGNTFYY